MLFSLLRLPPSVLLLSVAALVSFPPPRIAASPTAAPLPGRRQEATNATSSASAAPPAETTTAAQPEPVAVKSTKVQDYNGLKDPSKNGGQMLTIIDVTYPMGLGEPLNIILSADSTKEVLVDSKTNGGLRNYFLAMDFSESCLGLAATGGQKANLGDGQGVLNQTDELRYNFGDIYFGTCRETFEGGNHFRYWTQKTTGAVFMAASVEMDLSKGHDIVKNGYNLGRDEIVAVATGQDVNAIPAFSVNENSTFTGSMSYGNYTYQTDVRYVTGLLQNSSEGINHLLSVPIDGQEAIDGLVAVFTVKITSTPDGPGSPSSRSSSPSAFSLPILSALVAVTLASVVVFV